ncbi:retrovirus-related pol polyprotein from transposon tnt 1-94, partial [Trifolium medium]|nr:retrovirus-related pol polyprotein from transposon tnt 1-94 [Trifolium medium]
MDLMEPMQVESLGGKREKDNVIVKIRSDHGKEFENSKFSEFCASEGIEHEFSSPITPQQNGEAEAMNTACYIHNRVTLRSCTSTTLYELWKGSKPTVKHFHVFGSKCYILADREQRRKMDPKSDEGIFLGYSTNIKAYRVFNYRTKVMMESINVVIDDSSTDKVTDVEDDVEASDQQLDMSDGDKDSESNSEMSISESENIPSNKGPSVRVQKNHPKELIIGD